VNNKSNCLRVVTVNVWFFEIIISVCLSGFVVFVLCYVRVNICCVAVIWKTLTSDLVTLCVFQSHWLTVKSTVDHPRTDPIKTWTTPPVTMIRSQLMFVYTPFAHILKLFFVSQSIVAPMLRLFDIRSQCAFTGRRGSWAEVRKVSISQCCTIVRSDADVSVCCEVSVGPVQGSECHWRLVTRQHAVSLDTQSMESYVIAYRRPCSVRQSECLDIPVQAKQGLKWPRSFVFRPRRGPARPT